MGIALPSDEKKIKIADLTNWINMFKSKKSSLKHRRRRNLYAEAVITEAICRAESVLRHKQRLRKQKWQSLKSSWQHPDDQPVSDRPVWDSKTCEDLNSLDNFLWEINQIKIPLDR